MSSSRYLSIEAEVRAVMKSLSGRELIDTDRNATFFDLGFDSLLLTQASQSLRQKFGVKISFRQLMETLVTIEDVSHYLEEHLPPAPAVESVPVKPSPAPTAPVATHLLPLQPATNGDSLVDRILKQQLALMTQQLELLRRSSDSVSNSQKESASLNGKSAAAHSTAPHANGHSTSTGIVDSAPRFGPYKPVDRNPAGGLTPRQQDHLDHLIEAYVKRTARSKAYTQKHRKHFADPRTVAGFRQSWKEMVYPLVVKRSEGSRLWDLDQNEYIDLTMGFGTNLFGHSPAFLTRALSNQLRHGVEVGPQSPLAGKVAQLICELTGMERAAFCSTGSEAILAAVRLARTITGRTRIATMSGYHGINDEVLVRAQLSDGVRRPAPIAPGIPQHLVDEVLVLDYGTPESLELLRAHAHELAAVLVEPVQSRRPDLVPVEFLREVRKITAASETALVFDEIITGFRMHPGGTQALFGIQADLATYGKIIGGGMPIGALCGKAKYMDALDGGAWQYGDDSSPEVGMTFFAGTYVRHPLAMRAALSVLSRLKREGPRLQEELGARTDRFAHDLNRHLEREAIPMRVTWFGSMIYFVFQPEFKFSNLLFFHLRFKGIHLWEGRPFFLSTAHTDADIDFILRSIKESLEELRAGDFLPQPAALASTLASSFGKAALEKALAEPVTRPAKTQFSLYFFGNYDAAYREDKYGLLKEAAQFADTHGFTAVWLPERHFHAVGGFSPNSSLLACALSSMTTRLQLRGGSVVLPLHHPVRVAEEWSVADNLSQGRTGISIATGWHPHDFVLAPEAFTDRRQIALQNLEVIQKLWRGEAVSLPSPGQETLPVKLYPLPRQSELPVWLTCIHQDSYAEAGRRGLHALGYLMNQSLTELAAKIAAYRDGRRSSGLNPATGHVTILLFTYLDVSVEKAREVARGPLCAYLRSYLNNSQKKMERQLGEVSIEEEDLGYLTERSCNDYFDGKSLIGTAESCAKVVERLREIGVDEIGCFIDFGIEAPQVLQSLEQVSRLIGPTALDASETLPLTAAEKGLWLLGATNPQAAQAYQESVTVSLTGSLDAAKLDEAFQAVVDRHGALRTTLATDGLTQTVHGRHTVQITKIDFSHLSLQKATSEALSQLEGFEKNGFSQTSGPFLSACLVKTEASRHLLTILFHHLVGNGPSYWVFLEELAEFYDASIGQRPVKLPPAFTYSAFVQERLRYETSPAREEAERFWMKQLEGVSPALDLPFDRSVPAELTYLGSREELAWPPDLIEDLKRIGSAQRCSLFTVLLSAYGVLLHRLCGQDDLIIGVPFDSPVRMENAAQNLFANTTNMLPLRSRMEEGMTFLEYLLQMKKLILAASEHQDYFFGHLIGKLGLKRDPSRAPFFNVIFNLETGEFLRDVGQLTMRLETQNVPYRCPRHRAMFDLYLNAAEQADGGFLVQCDYKTALLEGETVHRWLAHLETILRAVSADPHQLVAALPLVNVPHLEPALANL